MADERRRTTGAAQAEADRGGAGDHHARDADAWNGNTVADVEERARDDPTEL